MAKVNPETESLLAEARNQRIITSEQLDQRLQELDYLHNVLLFQSKQENDDKIDALNKEAQIRIDATYNNPNQRFCNLYNLQVDICDKFKQYTNIIESIFNELNYANQVTNGAGGENSPILVDLNNLSEHWKKFLQDNKDYLKITQEHRGEIEVYARNENQNQHNRHNQIKIELAEHIEELKLQNIQKIKKIEEYCEWGKAQIYLQQRNILNKIEVELAEKIKALPSSLNVLDENELTNVNDYNSLPIMGANLEQNVVGNPKIFEILD